MNKRPPLPPSLVGQSRIKGVVAVELAILMVPLMMLAFGAVEFGRAIYHYNTLAKAVRDGARLLAQNNPADASYAARQNEARCLVMHGNIDCTGPTLVPALTAAHVVLCDRVHLNGCTNGPYENVPTGEGLINLVEVKIDGYQFDYLGLPVRFDLSALPPIVFADIRSIMRQII